LFSAQWHFCLSKRKRYIHIPLFIEIQISWFANDRKRIFRHPKLTKKNHFYLPSPLCAKIEESNKNSFRRKKKQPSSAEHAKKIILISADQTPTSDRWGQSARRHITITWLAVCWYCSYFFFVDIGIGSMLRNHDKLQRYHYTEWKQFLFIFPNKRHHITFIIFLGSGNTVKKFRRNDNNNNNNNHLELKA
jgi:hypothetical protein